MRKVQFKRLRTTVCGSNYRMQPPSLQTMVACQALASHAPLPSQEEETAEPRCARAGQGSAKAHAVAKPMLLSRASSVPDPWHGFQEPRIRNPCCTAQPRRVSFRKLSGGRKRRGRPGANKTKKTRWQAKKKQHAVFFSRTFELQRLAGFCAHQPLDRDRGASHAARVRARCLHLARHILRGLRERATTWSNPGTKNGPVSTR